MKRFAIIIKGTLLSSIIANLALAAPPRPDPTNLRECASCHVQWIEAFAQSQNILLMEKPTHPMEAESDVCLSCHDGSVVDSRRTVWVEHGHKNNITPPADMTIPETLPLQEGKIVCGTCHSAHLSDHPVNQENPIFLRIANDKSQLCQQCHQNYSGIHQSPPASVPIFQELFRDSESSIRYEVQCMTCHTPHGRGGEKLLHLTAGSNQLCLSCHQEKGLQRKGLHPNHPVISQAYQTKAIEMIGTRLDSKQRLICLSCHQMHHSQNERFLLALPLENSALCIRCHPDHQNILQSKHNPHEYASDLKNAQGLTIEQAGPCSRCHMMHSLAQGTALQDPKESGLCMNCHEDIQWGLNLKHPPPKTVLHPKIILETNEPMGCQSCHLLHTEQDSVGHLGRDLCYSCHSTHRSLEHTLHNSKALAMLPPMGNSSPCGPCHIVHANQMSSSEKLWAYPTDNMTTTKSEQRCQICHNNNDGFAHRPAIFEHPEAELMKGALQLFGKANDIEKGIDAMQKITCITCHLPHGQIRDHVFASIPIEEKPLDQLRANRNMVNPETAKQLCAQCHGFDAAKLYLYYHYPEKYK